MTPISADELADIQTAANAVLPFPAVIQRKTMTPDTMGQETEVWATVSSPGLMAGMRQPSMTLLQNYDFLISSQNTWVVHFPNGTDVRHQDRVIVAGITMVAQVILQPKSYSAYTDALCAAVH